MKKLIDLIKLAKLGDNAAMNEILEKFNNLINRYVRIMNYDEDCRSELILKLITLVKTEINIDKMRNNDDSAIVKYISYAIRNHYIAFSKAYCDIRDNETAFAQDAFVDLLEDNLHYLEDYEQGILMDMLRAELTGREYLCIRLLIFEGWTANEVAKKFGVSRQAVNQCKKRALKKIKKLYLIAENSHAPK